MKRSASSLFLILLLLSVSAGAAERPGLEVFDAGSGGTVDSSDIGVDYSSEPIITGPNTITWPQPLDPQAPPPQPPIVVPQDNVFNDPFSPRPPEPTPFQPAPAVNDPEYGEPEYGQPEPAGESALPPSAMPENQSGTYYPEDPTGAALADLNTHNYNYPGLADAAKAGDIQSAGAIVWETLRARRILQATMAAGPRASAGQSSPYEVQRVLESVNFNPEAAGADSPIRASMRINTILDSFSMPVIDDPAIGSNMPQIIVRLHSDIVAVREALHRTNDDAIYLELARTYARAATTCDFFSFPRVSLASDIIAMYERSGPMFYPDGASIAGDVGGVTGNLLSSLVMLDHYTRDDTRFRRDIRRAWQYMESPARYALGLALPDMSLPRFGPRGFYEMSIPEVMRLNEMFPRKPPQRIGLAASHSFPNSSNQHSYGGIFAMRSGLDSNGRYLAVRFGPLGIMPGVPAHHDFGSMEIMSRNVRFVIDAGGFGGAAATAEAHSGLSLNGQYVTEGTYNEPGKPVKTVWRTNAALDYATDMAGFADGKTWQRTVAYVKDLPGEVLSDYWVVLDHVDTKNDNRPQQARIRYQLAPGIQAYSDGAGVVASANYVDGSALRFFAVDSNAEMSTADGAAGLAPSFVFDSAGGQYASPSVVLSRTLVGSTTTSTVIYPSENQSHRPVRIERDSDLIRGRTGAIIVDHGHDRIDVIAWAPPGAELVTPTLNLQMSADLAVFRLRKGKLVRMNFVNLERFQAKEPNGGLWSMRVDGPVQTLTLEPEQSGGWQILSDPANMGSATLYDINFGPGIYRNKLSIRPGDMRVIQK